MACTAAQAAQPRELTSQRLALTTAGPLPKAVRGGMVPGLARPGSDDCYTPGDLRIGTTVSILGRPFLIYDADSATRAWYTVRRGGWRGLAHAKLPTRGWAKSRGCACVP